MTQTSDIASILEATRSMLDAARAADWAAVEALASARDRSLGNLAEPGAGSGLAVSRETLAEIERLNGEIVALLAPDVAALAGELGRLRQGRAAAAAYAGMSR